MELTNESYLKPTQIMNYHPIFKMKGKFWILKQIRNYNQTEGKLGLKSIQVNPNSERPRYFVRESDLKIFLDRILKG